MNKSVLSTIHLMLELLSYVLLIASFAVAIPTMASGKEIPVHFDMVGNITEYGGPGILIVVPLVMLIINSSVSVMLHCFPFSSWNMPFKVKPQNQRRVYGCVGYMIVIMAVLMSIFSLVFTILVGTGVTKTVGIFTIFFSAAVIADIIISLVAAGILNGK